MCQGSRTDERQPAFDTEFNKHTYCMSRLQLDVRNFSLGRRHLVNAYEVNAGIDVIAGNSV